MDGRSHRCARPQTLVLQQRPPRPGRAYSGAFGPTRGFHVADTNTHRAIIAARQLQPMIRACAEEAQLQRHVPGRHRGGDGRRRPVPGCAPACYGGDEADPVTTIGSSKAISMPTVRSAGPDDRHRDRRNRRFAHARRDRAARLFAEYPDLVMCGALNPLGRARPVPGGWRVSGRWPFASGCHHADLFWGQCIVEDTNRPGSSRCSCPREHYEILDTWNVTGLRGTGSHDLQVSDLFVPDGMITEIGARRASHDGPLYRLPPFSRLAYNKVGVSPASPAPPSTSSSAGRDEDAEAVLRPAARTTPSTAVATRRRRRRCAAPGLSCSTR